MAYQEGKDSTFTHDGATYPLDPFLARAKELKVYQIRVKDLKWNLDGMQLDAERVRKADTSVPILFTVHPKYGYVIIDGTHRLAKAVQQGKYSIPGREIPASWFEEIGTISMEDLNYNFTVGQVTREQVFEWLAVHNQARPEPPNEAAMSSEGAGVDRIYAFCWDGSEVAGYACLLNGQRYLIDMYVCPSYRRKGVGRLLINSLLIDLVVVKTYQTAIIEFLEKCGFRLENDFVNTRVYRKYHGPKVHSY